MMHLKNATHYYCYEGGEAILRHKCQNNEKRLI